MTDLAERAESTLVAAAMPDLDLTWIVGLREGTETSESGLEVPGALIDLYVAVVLALLLAAWWLNEANRTGQVIGDINAAELAFRVVEVVGLAAYGHRASGWLRRRL